MEVAVPTGGRRTEFVVAREIVQQYLSQTGDLLQSFPILGIGDSQVKKLKRPSEGQAAVFQIALGGPGEGALYLASHVRELLEKRERPPSSLRQLSMLHAHRLTSLLDQALNHETDDLPRLGIVHPARPIALGRTDVDHGVELDALVFREIGIEVDPPKIPLF
jgi:hypothetical protein